MPYIIGIDPGLTGAMAVIGQKRGILYEVYDLPTMSKGKGKGRVKNQINPYALRDLIIGNSSKRSAPDDIACVVIEIAQAMPAQGASSTFIIGHTAGIIEGVVAALGLKYILIGPSQWKKFYKLGTDKEQSRAAAIRLFPDSMDFSLKKHHNRSEAVLIANWARIMLKRGELS